MARTIDEIQADILTAIGEDSVLSGLNSSSTTAVYRLITRVVAGAIAVLENLFDLFKTDVATILATQKPSSLPWYQQMALNFQYGFSLPEGEIYYDNTGVSEDAIADSKVIEKAAVVEEGTSLVVKAVQIVGGDLTPLPSAAKDAFEAYMNEIKDAGVPITVISTEPDHIKLTLDIYYDAQVIGPDGARLDGSDSTPVATAIDNYLLNLEFDGDFVKSHLVDTLQQVPGVKIPVVRLAQAARDADPNYVEVDVRYRPYSGFLKVYEAADLTINYIAYV
jgi:hypothetical protein